MQRIVIPGALLVAAVGVVVGYMGLEYHAGRAVMAGVIVLCAAVLLGVFGVTRRRPA